MDLERDNVRQPASSLPVDVNDKLVPVNSPEPSQNDKSDETVPENSLKSSQNEGSASGSQTQANDETVPENNSKSPQDENTDDDITQVISGRHISSTRLIAQLKRQFGEGKYYVNMVHNSYNITAPRELSVSEIAECRRY
ncbi:hypothetical protein HD806DRAFT_545129 [Xylariaceae sp. AK1471]|nr:hypothetical protein HD806DRAFT_545129 [Xylariaceae sp. AK1471]